MAMPPGQMGGQLPMGGPPGSGPGQGPMGGPIGPGAHMGQGPHMQQQQPPMGPGGHLQAQMHGVPGGPGGPMAMGPQPGGHMPPQQHPQSMHGPQGPPPGTVGHHPQQQHPSSQEQPKLDNISKAKSLLAPMRESLQATMKTAAQAVAINNMIDSGSKQVDFDIPIRFERSLEEFFSLCDQMEMNLKTSIECITQSMSSQRYMPTPVTPIKTDGSLTYPQYVNVVRSQISYAKEIHGTLADAAQKLSE